MLDLAEASADGDGTGTASVGGTASGSSTGWRTWFAKAEKTEPLRRQGETYGDMGSYGCYGCSYVWLGLKLWSWMFLCHECFEWEDIVPDCKGFYFW